MAQVNSDDSDFSDDVLLVASMKTHTCSQGLGAAGAVVITVPIKKGAPKRNVGAPAVFALRMDAITKYALNTSARLDKFTQEIILMRIQANMDADLAVMSVRNARDVRSADTKNCVDFWNDIPATHGDVHSMFNH